MDRRQYTTKGVVGLSAVDTSAPPTKGQVSRIDTLAVQRGKGVIASASSGGGYRDWTAARQYSQRANRQANAEYEQVIADLAEFKEGDNYDLDAALRKVLFSDPTRTDNPELRAKLVKVFGQEAVDKADNRVRIQASIDAVGGPEAFLATGRGPDYLLQAGYDFDTVNALWRLQPYMSITSGYAPLGAGSVPVSGQKVEVGIDYITAAKTNLPDAVFAKAGLTQSQISSIREVAKYNDLTEAVQNKVSESVLLEAGYIKEDINKAASFIENNVQIGKDEWLSKADYAALSPGEQTRIKEIGLSAFAAEQSGKMQAVAKITTNIDVNDPESVIKAVSTGAITVDELLSTGVITKQETLAVQKEADNYAKLTAALSKIDSNEYKNADGSYNLEAIFKGKPLSPGEIVLVFGQTEDGRDAIKAASDANLKRAKKALAHEYRPILSKAAEISRTYLDVVVPGYATQRHWSTMSTPMKAFSIALDVVSIVPVLGQAGKGAKAMAITGRTTRLSRVGGAIKGLWTPAEFARGLSPKRFTASELSGLLAKKPISKLTTQELSKISASQLTKTELKQLTKHQVSQLATRKLVLPGGMAGEAIAQVAWPAHVVGVFERPVAVGLKSVRHPIRIGKVTARTATRVIKHPLRAANNRLTESAMIGTFKSMASGIETAVRPRKLPEAILTNADGTVRLLLKDTTSADDALKIRNKLMRDAVTTGQNPVIIIGDTRYELELPPLIKELKGGAAHATPSGDAFEAGVIIKEKPNMSLKEQGLFVGHEPYTKFTTRAAFGGTGSLPSILVFSPEMAKELVVTEKIYRGTVEMELKFRVGYKIPPPKQRLFTRVGEYGERVEIFLWKPLSKTQIVKLKAQGLVEQVRTIVSPSLKITNTAPTNVPGLTVNKVDELANIIEGSGSVAEAESLRRLGREIRQGRSVADSLRALQLERSRVATNRIDITVNGRITEGGIETRSETTRTDSRANTQRLGTNRITTPVRTVGIDRVPSRTSDSRTDATRTDTARTDIIRTDALRADTTRSEIPRVDAPRVDIVRPEVPRVDIATPRVGISRVTPGEGKRTDIIPPLLGDDDKKRQRGLLAESSVTWRQGQLHGRDVWVIVTPPYDRAIYSMTKPQGVREIEGPRSAYKTAIILKGPLQHTVQLDIGAFIAKVEPSSPGRAKLSFAKDTGTLAPVEGTIVWQQGELHGKPVYVVATPPYGQDDVKFVMQKPEGVREVKGPDQATVLHGKLVRTPLIQVGAFRVRVTKSKKKHGNPSLTFYRGDSSELSGTR